MTRTDIDREFGDLLRKARTDAGLSIREVARRVGMDPTHLSRIERGLAGRPTWERIVAIARQFPSSGLAKTIDARGGEMLRNEVLGSARRTLAMLLNLAPVHFVDDAWGRAVKDVLESSLAILQRKTGGGDPRL